MDEKIGDRVNALNTSRYRTKQRQARLHDLQMQYKQLSGKDADEDGSGGRGDRASSGNGRSGSGTGSRSDGDASNDGSRDKETKENDEGQVSYVQIVNFSPLDRATRFESAKVKKKCIGIQNFNNFQVTCQLIDVAHSRSKTAWNIIVCLCRNSETWRIDSTRQILNARKLKIFRELTCR